MIECGDLFRQAHRVPQGEQENCRTNADPARPHGDCRGQQQGAEPMDGTRAALPGGEKWRSASQILSKPKVSALVGRRQHGVKRLPLCLAFVVVAIHHQPNIHTHRPLPTQAVMPCAALSQGPCGTQSP